MSTRLTRLVIEVEAHVAAHGWDQPPQLYALVETADLLRREPQLAEQMDLVAAGPGDLTPVEQGDLPDHSSLQDLLGGLVWPPEVLGAAIAVERLMLPPTVEDQLPREETEALRWLAEHPERQEVRLVVAVLRDGTRAAALRMRAHDHETAVLSGPDLVPALADALAETLRD
jgi:hypothetical protein